MQYPDRGGNDLSSEPDRTDELYRCWGCRGEVEA